MDEQQESLTYNAPLPIKLGENTIKEGKVLSYITALTKLKCKSKDCRGAFAKSAVVMGPSNTDETTYTYLECKCGENERHSTWVSWETKEQFNAFVHEIVVSESITFQHMYN